MRKAKIIPQGVKVTSSEQNSHYTTFLSESLAFFRELYYNTYCASKDRVFCQEMAKDLEGAYRTKGGRISRRASMANHFKGTNDFLAERLRQARLKAGYSQQNVADALMVNRATYTYYETGKTSPDPATLGKIARIFGVPIDYFYPDEDQEEPLLLTDRERCPKKTFLNPGHVGELSADEKKLIAVLRANQRVSVDEIVEYIQHMMEYRQKN